MLLLAHIDVVMQRLLLCWGGRGAGNVGVLCMG